MLRQTLLAVLVLSVLIALVMVGCQEAAPVAEEPEVENESGEDNNTDTENDEDAPQPVDAIMLDLYFMEIKETSFELGKETRNFGTFGGPQVDLEEVINELLKGPETDDLSRVIPEGTVLRGITLEYGVAYVDFSEGLLQAEVGAEAEAILVDSIVKTLTQLEEVDSVQILVEGEIVETIAGHISIDKPLN